MPEECGPTYENFNNDIMYNIDIYDIYAKCYHEDTKGHVRFLRDVDMDLMGSGTPPCTSANGINEYLSDPTVQAAYHISEHANPWEMCASPPVLNYTIDYVHGSLYTYPYLMSHGLKIMIYSGDVDGAVPTIGTRQWIAKLDLPVVDPYQSWTIEEGQVSGYKV